MKLIHADSVDGGVATEVGHGPPGPLWVAAAAAVAIHNTEEWLLDLTGWVAGHSWLPGRSLHGSSAEFGLVLAIVTLAVLALAAVAVIGRPRWSATVLVCLAYALMVNGISHGVLSLLSWSPMPGVISGLAMLLPLGAVVSRRLPPVRWSVSTVALTVGSAAGVTSAGSRWRPWSPA